MNKSDYNFWKDEIQQLFKKEEERILIDAGVENFWENIREEAKIEFLKKLGIYDFFTKIIEIDKEIIRLEEQQRELKNKLFVPLEKFYPCKFGRYSGLFDIERLADTLELTKKQLPKIELGRRILEIREEGNTFLRTLALLSSKKEIQDFIKTVYARFNVDLINLDE